MTARGLESLIGCTVRRRNPKLDPPRAEHNPHASFSDAQRIKLTGAALIFAEGATPTGVRLTAGLGPADVAMSTGGCGSGPPEIFMDALICLLPPLRSIS
jgi:hypothetical protein